MPLKSDILQDHVRSLKRRLHRRYSSGQGRQSPGSPQTGEATSTTTVGTQAEGGSSMTHEIVADQNTVTTPTVSTNLIADPAEVTTQATPHAMSDDTDSDPLADLHPIPRKKVEDLAKLLKDHASESNNESLARDAAARVLRLNSTMEELYLITLKDEWVRRPFDDLRSDYWLFKTVADNKRRKAIAEASRPHEDRGGDVPGGGRC